MRKKDLAELMSETMGCSKAEAMKSVNTMLDILADALKQGEEVDLNGFGKFSIATRAAREGINPATKEKIHIPETKTVKFKVTKSIKDDLNA